MGSCVLNGKLGAGLPPRADGRSNAVSHFARINSQKKPHPDCAGADWVG